MKKTLLTILALATTLVACQKQETPAADQTRKAVKFSVQNLGTYEFKSPTLALGQDGCSPVGIYASDLGANNVQATVAGSTLTPASTIYWGIGQTTASTFVARYPHANGAGITDAYEVPNNQTDDDTFTYQENLMHAVTTATPDPGTVAFDFKHPFAKVVVNITNNLGADEAASVTMAAVNTKATSLNIGTAPATITLSAEASDIKTVTAHKTSATKFEMVVLPQDATNNMDIVVTTSLNSTYTFHITNVGYSFVPGKISNVNITLNPVDGNSGAGLNAVGAMTFSAPEEWTDGDATTVGSDTPTVGSGYYQIGGCVYMTADKATPPAAWTKYYYMTYSGNNLWTVTINYDESLAANDGEKGFKFRHDNTYWGMWTGENPTEYIADGTTDYILGSTSGFGNIKLEKASGNYTLTFNSSTKNITTVYNGAKEE